jgi:tol-pal system protein YbgF
MTPEMRALNDRLSQLQRDVSGMQQQLYSRPSGIAGGGPIGGGAAGGAMDGSVAAQFDVRMSSLEDQIRQLTGQLEETRNAIQQVRQRLDQLVSDVDTRLSMLEHPGGSPAVGGMPPDPSLSTAPPPALPPPTGAAPIGAPPAGLAPGPRNLGAVSPRDVPPPPSTAALAAATSSAPPAGANAKQEYDYAFDLIKKQDYPGAEAGFKQLLKDHPKDTLADNAEYWLGETYYVRKNYADAAAQFLSAYKRNKKGAKAPDSFYKLGMSLANLGKKPEACAVFGQFSQEFPTAVANLKQQANEEKKRLSCS